MVRKWKILYLGFQAEQHGSSPSILSTSSPPVVYTERGKSIRLKCMYHAEPKPKVNWLKDGVEVRHDCDTCISTVETQTDTSFLEITPYTKDDFGDYECRVRNIYGSTKLKVSLKKIGKKSNRWLMGNLHYRLTCDLDNKNEIPGKN